MAEQEYFIKIPKNRIAVLIGPEGETKSSIEKQTKSKIEIDSENGEVKITSTQEAEDPLLVWRAKDVISAIARGFSPENAFSLLDEEQFLDIIDLTVFCGKSKNNLVRVKGRIIGEKGKTRRLIEEMTDAHISVLGHTVSIIGDQVSIDISRNAITMLIKGSQHSSVYKFLSRKRSQIKKSKFSIWKTFKLEDE